MPYTIEKKVQPILIRLYCDCGREMNFEKKTFLCYPPKYVDSKMHPLILRRIVQMFTNKETNPNGAQLIFSAHNIINLDASDLRRDEIWFVEKKNHKSTMCALANLDLPELNVRADLNYGKNYLNGRFGAVPFKDKKWFKKKQKRKSLVETGISTRLARTTYRCIIDSA